MVEHHKFLFGVLYFALLHHRGFFYLTLPWRSPCTQLPSTDASSSPFFVLYRVTLPNPLPSMSNSPLNSTRKWGPTWTSNTSSSVSWCIDKMYFYPLQYFKMYLTTWWLLVRSHKVEKNPTESLSLRSSSFSSKLSELCKDKFSKSAKPSFLKKRCNFWQVKMKSEICIQFCQIDLTCKVCRIFECLFSSSKIQSLNFILCFSLTKENGKMPIG